METDNKLYKREGNKLKPITITATDIEQRMNMFGTGSQDKSIKEESSVEQLNREIQAARRRLANKLVDYFNALDSLGEKEFIEIASTLEDGNGVAISTLIEKYRRYHSTDKPEA